ncbi:isoprenoid synthase domain-containing protein [Mycena galopus ATCC 62051]|nr:isoprenoid synthase domain-containing protein [Mycena galopus ATCC 62051]
MSESRLSYSNLLLRLSGESSWSDQDELAVSEPFSYIISNPEKDIRTQLLAMLNLWLNVPGQKIQKIAKSVAMLHNASLMCEGALRRGAPVAHKLYGIPQTINAANYVYFLPYEELLKLSRPDATLSPAELKNISRPRQAELISLHRGQGLELLWRDSLQCPSEEQYVDMLMMACGTTNLDIDYMPLVYLIGVHFQIRDDYMDLQSGDYTANKGSAEDLTEGKFSFPIVHGINADKMNRQLLNTLQKRPTTPTLKTHAISYLDKQTGSFSYTRSVLQTLEQQIRAEVETGWKQGAGSYN